MHGIFSLFIEKGYQQYNGLLLEQYFRDEISLEERVTEIGSFWDSTGQNEIDIVPLNNLDKTAVLAEVKRNPKKIDLKLLEHKSIAQQKELAAVETKFIGLSMHDT